LLLVLSGVGVVAEDAIHLHVSLRPFHENLMARARYKPYSRCREDEPTGAREWWGEDVP
jgi:hypothetical protein